MKINFSKFQIFIATVFIMLLSLNANAQVFEWRLANTSFNATDPDGGGPATGSVTFTMQIHTVSGSVPDVSGISTGWSYQSTLAMIPTTPGCAVISNPANVTLSAAFITGGFSFTTVNQCGVFAQTAGGRNFDRRAVGTLDGTGIAINTTWIDVYTVTLWALGVSNPEAGYAVINSGSGGSPAPFGTYAVADVGATEYVVNSLTYNTPLALGTVVPVTFTKFSAQCNSNGALVTWSTAQELNSSHFELERSTNGTDWKAIAKIEAAGQSALARNYQQLDLNGGNALYRIKQVDIDGSYIYTDIIRTNCESKAITHVIYPVPARDVLNVVIRSDRSLKTQILVVDGIGQVVRKREVTIASGNNNFSINLSGLSSGLYTIRSIEPALKLNRQFTITH